MNALRLMAAGVFAVVLLSGARAEEKKADANKEKLVGTWEATKSDGGLPVGSVVVFEKDGKLKVTTKKDGKEETHEGTYTVSGDSFSIALKFGDEVKKQKITIKKLTADDLSTTDEGGKAVELKRKK